MLALAAPRRVGEDALIDGLWGDDPPQTAGKVVHNQVARLRKACRATGDHIAMIETTPGGYRLALPVHAVDVRAAEALLDEGRAAVGAGEPARASELLATALARWRGDALADVGHLPFARSARSHVAELRWTLLEERVAADLVCGYHHALVPELQEAVSVAPLRERLWEQLLVALYRCGRQADALRAFQDMRRRLDDGLGIAPGRRAVALERAIAAGNDEALGVRPEVPFGTVGRTVRAGPVLTGGLLRPRTRLIGRDQDVAQVRELLAATGVVTIVGPGGVGKTRLAVAIAGLSADAYRDGVMIVDLAALDDEQSVVLAAAAAVGVALDIDEAPVATLIRGLADRHVLIVLDNCEHVIAAAAALVEALSHSCRDVSILSTSREALRTGNEALWHLAPLALPDPDGPVTAATVGESRAVELFVDRAALRIPGFRLDDSNAPTVAAIVAGLDGIPLALELAAAALDGLNVDALGASLADRFAVLRSGRRTAPARQATLWAMIDWSYTLLEPADRLLFDRLAVFAADFTAEAADDVCGDDFLPGEAIGRLHRLVARSLVQPVDIAAIRFRLLDSVRDFAQRHLNGRVDTAQERLRDWALGVAVPAGEATAGGDDAPALDVLDAEYANLLGALRSAVDSGDSPRALQLVGALGVYWNARGRKREGHRWCVAALGLPADGADSAFRGAALLAAADMVSPTATDEQDRYLAAAEEAARADGDANLLARVWLEQGLAAWRADGYGDSETAERLYQQTVTLARQTGNHAAWAEATGRLGWLSRSISLVGEAAAVHRRAKYRRGLFWCLATRLELEVGLADRVRIADECLALARELRYPYGESYMLSKIGLDRLSSGDPDGAIAVYRPASAICRRISEGNHLSWSLRGLARAHAVRGDAAVALDALTEVVSGHVTGAVHADEMGRLLRDAAITLGAVGELDAAAQLIGAREASTERFVDPAFDEDAYRRTVAACRDALGPEQFAAACQLGAPADPVVLIASVLDRARQRSGQTGF